jgi:hypothetical protein
MPLTLIVQTISSQLGIWDNPYTVAWLGIVVGVFGIAVAIWAAVYQVQKQRVKKELIYQKISEAPIVTVNSDVASRVEVLLDGKSAKGVRLLVFAVKNVGSGAVTVKDYFEPLTFHFDVEVVGGEVLKTEPGAFLDPSQFASFLIFKERAVQLSACPLNPGDAITFSIFIEGEGLPVVHGRINSGTIREFDPITEQTRKQKRLNRFLSVTTTATLILILPGFIYFFYEYSVTNRPVIMSGVLAYMMLGAFLLFGISAIISILIRRNSKKK